MTSPDRIRELQASRPSAPPSLRERVREIGTPEAVELPLRRFRFSLPRPMFIAVPAAAALVLALGTAGVVGLAGSGAGEQADTAAVRRLGAIGTPGTTTTESSAKAPPILSAPGATAQSAQDATVGPTSGRAQRVAATLTVKVRDSDHVSRAAQEALDVTRSLGGHVLSASVATGDEANAALTVRIPVEKTQEAVMRLSALGTIVSQQVSIEDLQETIDNLLRRTRSLRAQIVRIAARLESETLDPEERAALELRRKNLQAELRAFRRGAAATRAESRFATIQLSVVTPDSLGVVPATSRLDRALDKAVEVLVWEGIVALVVLLVAAPLAILGIATWLLRRVYRRHEEERLLAAS